jgi:hypothetical protein
MMALRSRVVAAVGDRSAVVFEYHPGSLGVADGWNRIAEIGFDDVLGRSDTTGGQVNWIMIMNNDIMLGPEVLRNFTHTTDRLKNQVAVHNLNGFTAFAITRLGWAYAGKFEPSFWPAYPSDSEYCARIKAAGLLRANFYVAAKNIRFAPSVDIASDSILPEWKSRLDLPQLLSLKWGLNFLSLVESKLGADDYSVARFPYGLGPAYLLPSSTCIVPDHRQCVKTGSGLRIGEQKCELKLASVLQACGVQPALIRKALSSNLTAAPAVLLDYNALARNTIVELLTQGQAAKNKPDSKRSCFIPILVLAVFREVDALHDFVTKLPCSVGMLVIRTIGPSSRNRRIVRIIADAVTKHFDPKLEMTERSKFAFDDGFSKEEYFSTFTRGIFDVGFLPRFSLLSVGAAFAHALRQSDAFSDVVFGRRLFFAGLGVVKYDSLGPIDYCAEGNSTMNQTSWKRWAMFLDVEQLLTNPGALVELAHNMAARTESPFGCRSAHISVVSQNFFAVTVSTLRISSVFGGATGFSDVVPAFIAKVQALTSDSSAMKVTVAHKAFVASNVSGYDLSVFEPFQSRH